jgi:hypothetical protein
MVPKKHERYSRKPGLNPQGGRYRDWRALMLKALRADQAHFVALLAKTARMERDAFLGSVREEAFSEPKAAHGEHNPIAALGLGVNAAGEPQIAALRDAITGLAPAGRAELYTLMRVGQGDLAAQKWHRGIIDAEALGDETVTASLIEDPDLHDHLLKGLYEAKVAS